MKSIRLKRRTLFLFLLLLTIMLPQQSLSSERPGITDFYAVPNSFSPNNDGVKDESVIYYTIFDDSSATLDTEIDFFPPPYSLRAPLYDDFWHTLVLDSVATFSEGDYCISVSTLIAINTDPAGGLHYQEGLKSRDYCFHIPAYEPGEEDPFTGYHVTIGWGSVPDADLYTLYLREGGVAYDGANWVTTTGATSFGPFSTEYIGGGGCPNGSVPPFPGAPTLESAELVAGGVTAGTYNYAVTAWIRAAVANTICCDGEDILLEIYKRETLPSNQLEVVVPAGGSGVRLEWQPYPEAEYYAVYRTNSGAAAWDYDGDGQIGDGDPFTIAASRISPAEVTETFFIDSGAASVQGESPIPRLVVDYPYPVGRPVGDNTYTWDGYDGNGDLFPDGHSAYEIVVIDEEGPPNLWNATGFAQVDYTRPQIFRVSAIPPVTDGAVDFHYDVNENVIIDIQIYNVFGELIRSLSGTGDQTGNSISGGFQNECPTDDNVVEWDGTDINGVQVPNGIYTYFIDAIDDAGNSAVTQLTGTIEVNSPLHIYNLAASPEVFSPNGDTFFDQTTISYELSTTSQVRKWVLNQYATNTIAEFIGGAGNGELQSFTILDDNLVQSENWTVLFDTPTTFDVIGSLSLNVGSGVVGTPFVYTAADDVFSFLISAGTEPFVAGDVFSFGTYALLDTVRYVDFQEENVIFNPQTYVWNGFDDAGRALDSGPYIIRLHATNGYSSVYDQIGVVIDLEPPEAPIFLVPSVLTSADNMDIEGIVPPNAAGTVDAEIVQLYVRGSFFGTAEVDPGTGSFQFDNVPLEEGQNSIMARARDAAYNFSGFNEEIITRDITAPVLIRTFPSDNSIVNPDSTDLSQMYAVLQDANRIIFPPSSISILGPHGTEAGRDTLIYGDEGDTLFFLHPSPTALDTGQYTMQITAVDTVGNVLSISTTFFVSRDTVLAPLIATTVPEDRSYVTAPFNQIQVTFIDRSGEGINFNLTTVYLWDGHNIGSIIEDDFLQTNNGLDEITVTFYDYFPTDGSRDDTLFFRIHVEDYAEGTLVDYTSYWFVYDTSPPDIGTVMVYSDLDTLTIPAATDTSTIAGSVTRLSVELSDSLGNIDLINSTVTLTGPNGAIDVFNTNNGTDQVVLLFNPLVDEGFYEIGIIPVDVLGNTGLPRIYEFYFDQLVPQITDVGAEPNPFSPGNQDGYLDETLITFSLTQSAQVRIEISDINNDFVAYVPDANYTQFTAAESPHYVVWDGTQASDGAFVPSGVYTYTIIAFSNQAPAEIVQAIGTVVIDNTAPVAPILEGVECPIELLESVSTTSVTIHGTHPEPGVTIELFIEPDQTGADLGAVDSTLLISQGTTIVLTDGSFEYDIALDSGLNEVVGFAIDQVGNRKTLELSSTMCPPTSGPDSSDVGGLSNPPRQIRLDYFRIDNAIVEPSPFSPENDDGLFEQALVSFDIIGGGTAIGHNLRIVFANEDGLEVYDTDIYG
ncbi:MAG: hypothetical protein GY869_29880, partial [Planctomycetes bacterium]|nr:hypothetical protein [Planctomycetota bacterium]